MLFQMRTVYTTIHIPLLWIVFQKTLFINKAYIRPNVYMVKLRMQVKFLMVQFGKVFQKILLLHSLI